MSGWSGRLVVGYEVAIGAALGAGVLVGVAQAFIGPALRRAVVVFPDAEVNALLALTAAGGALAAAHSLGPVWASRTDLLWRSHPVLLARRTAAAAAGFVVCAAATGGVTAIAARATEGGSAGPGPLTAGAVLLAGVVALAFQRLGRPGWTAGAAAGCTVAVLAVLAVPAGALPLTVLLAGAAYVGAVRSLGRGTVARPRQWHEHPPCWELLRAAEFVDALRTTTVMMDGVALELLRDTRLSARAAAGRPPALLLLTRIVTAPRTATLLPLLVLPAAVREVWGAGAAVWALQVTTIVFSWRVSRLLEVYLGSAVLRRMYAVPGNHLGGKLLTATAVCVAGYAAVAAALSSLSPPWVFVALLVSLLSLLRRASGRRLAGRVGPLVSTPMGGIPLDLASRVVAGPDVLVLAPVVTTAVGAGPALVALLIVTVLYLLVTITRRQA